MSFFYTENGKDVCYKDVFIFYLQIICDIRYGINQVQYYNRPLFYNLSINPHHNYITIYHAPYHNHIIS